MTRPDYVPTEARDVTQFGAVPDQNDHSTAAANWDAFRTAMDDAGTDGSIYVPPGTFWIGHDRGAGMFTFGLSAYEPAGISVYGAGPEQSIIRQSGEYEDWEGSGDGCHYRGDGVDHGDVEWRGIQFDGNYSDVPIDGGVSQPGFWCQEDISIHLRIENCYVRRWYSEGIRQRAGSNSNLTVNRCTFEENGVGRNRYDGGAGHHIENSSTSDGTFDVMNSKFLNCSGTCLNLRRGGAHVKMSKCWISGTGDALSKLSDSGFHGTVEYSNIYHEASTEFTRNELDGKPGHYGIYDLSGGNDRTLILNDVETRNHTVYGLRATGSNTVTVQGGNSGPVAIVNSALASDRREAVRADSSSATLEFDSFGRLSFHHLGDDSSDDIFNAPGGSGEIEAFRWSGYDSMGDTGSISFESVDERNDPFEPDVPSEEDVGINSGENSSGNPSEENPDSPLFEDWTPRWESSSDDWEVTSGDDYVGGYALSFSGNAGDRTRYALSLDTVGQPEDVEVLDRCRVPSFADNEGQGYHARIYLRAGVENNNEIGYWLEKEDPLDGYRLAKYQPNGYISTLERFGTAEENEFVFRRFRVEGNELKVKVWGVTDPEPEEWDVEVVDEAFTEGWVGLGSFDPEEVEFDTFSVTTDGSTAELPGMIDESDVSLENPTDGDTLSGDTEVAVSVEGKDQVDVDYQIDDTGWATLEYDPDSGYYSDVLDTTNLANGEYRLSVRVTGDTGEPVEVSISVSVENEPTVHTASAENVDRTNAILVGEAGYIPGDGDGSAFFQWRQVDGGEWEETDTEVVSSNDQFEREISGLESDTEYEYRAVLEVDDLYFGDTLTLITDSEDGSEPNSPSIDRFDIHDNSNQNWSRFDVDWTVSQEGGELDTVITKLRYQGSTVAAEATGVRGTSESYTHVVRVRGAVDEVRLSVNDTENRVSSETVEV